MLDKTANASLYDFWVKKVRTRMTDPVKRDIVAPLEQFQWIGTGRLNLEVDYYEMLDRPNVKLVDLKKTPIKEFNESGVVTEDQEARELHDLDVVIVATGYDAVTGSLLDMGIRDKNGVSLQDKWKDGIQTNLGMVLPDMPNAFMLYGTQAPTSLANGPPFIEMQVDWIVHLLKKARAENIESIEPSQKAIRMWGDTVWAAC
ncbi:Flavin-containing monooxygenase-like protein [Tolypocladium paradoxum]|uniref:Flavin-containing monooxygenase-like protein n=1 Tax=Tolypocladium paradoxum TaxID=94208 RepID=A0A2S4KZX3_9HYPO|nr:Flavin-containing monooxygenase-like protein [Tolypocladium paradoxum]